MYGDVTTDKDKTLALLRERGIVKVEVHFSGGNDEGGADDVTATLKDGTQTRLNPGNAHQDWNSKEWVVGAYDETHKYATRPATPGEVAEATLSELLEAPVYDTYDSFAGEFYVDGTVTWDVDAGTCTMTRSEQVMTHDDVDDLDW